MTIKEQILLGCVADDFTGASDAASFLVKEGIRTILINGVPKADFELTEECNAVVIALKTRTDIKERAIRDSIDAFDWLRDRGAKHLYSKYCSTFDSTREGNIGPILDAILEKYNEKATILCPALPVNKRTVVNGRLYVDRIPLHESSMKDHPLTPMWEADIAKLMEPQSKYPCMKVDYEMLQLPKEEVLNAVEEFGREKEHFYIITDYRDEGDAAKIAEVFGGMGILSGGSGILSQLGIRYKTGFSIKNYEAIESGTKGQGIILAGSCSVATLGQIEVFQQAGGISYKIDPIKLYDEELTFDMIWDFIEENSGKDVLIYSSDKSEEVRKIQQVGKEEIAHMLESTMADVAKRAVDTGIKRIIVAGGETSGAVTKGLGYDAFIIGESIAPSVPVMMPVNDKEVRLVLKSGNFGQPDFFNRALQMTKE